MEKEIKYYIVKIYNNQNIVIDEIEVEAHNSCEAEELAQEIYLSNLQFLAEEFTIFSKKIG